MQISNFVTLNNVLKNLRLNDVYLKTAQDEHDALQPWIYGLLAYTIGYNCPKLREALSLAGYTFVEYPEGTPFADQKQETFFLEFETGYISRSAMKFIASNVTTNAAMHIFVQWNDATLPLDVNPAKPLENDRVRIAVQSAFNDAILMVEKRYGDNLLKIAKAYFDTDYKPLENYSMTQTETPNITRDVTTNQNTKLTVTSDRSDNVYGFNSSSAVPASEGDSSSTTEGKGEDNETKSVEKETGTRTLTRAGNIGVVSSQQMLESELNLRRFDFTEMVYDCLDSVYCRNIY